MRHIETSKKVLGGSLIACLIFAVAGFVGWFIGREDALGIIALVFALATLIVKFYMVKAERENLLKIRRANKFTNEQLQELVDMSEKITNQKSEGE